MNSNRRINLKFLLILLSCLPFTPAFAVDYYVSALTGSDSNNGITTATAFRTIQKAADLTNPGDTVFIMNGTYSQVKTLYSIHKTVLYISRSGSELGGFITYKNYPGHTPKISGENSIWNCVLIRANYIRFEGIELEGPNQTITYEQAKDMYDYYIRGENLDWYLIGTMNTNGLSLGGNMGTGPKTIYHHIEVRNCTVHDFQGGGIGGSDFDYITIENNTVYNNSWYGMYATSGISVFHSHDIDNNTVDYKNIVRGNICYNNKTLIPWAGRDILSDGNGIIIDDNRNSQITGVPYTGKTLVENNISYNNGGSGIHAYSSNNVDIINNTAWNNGTVVGYPEIYGQDGTNVNIYNNIMYARMGGACNSNAGGTTYDFNIYYNGPASRMGPNDVVADPKIVKLATDGTADFHLRSNSPAINTGSDTPGKYSSIDIEGVERPVGAKPDRGAYESEFLEQGNLPEITVWQDSVTKITSTGSFIFGDVLYDTPQTKSFTIENTGDSVLILTGSPKVTLSGDGFLLISDADSMIAPNSSSTFKVQLTTAAEIDYTGQIHIGSNDPYQTSFVFTVKGSGKDPEKLNQEITFNTLPFKNIGDENFIPEASASSGLPVSFSSSDITVATIVNGMIHIAGLGTTIITATQEGDESTHPAPAVSQTLSVIPVVNLSATNLVSNPTFNSGTTGWSFSYQNAGSASVASVEKNGYSSNVGKVSITSTGSTSSAYNVQFGTNVQVVAGKQYAIMFKASADADRMVNLFMLKNVSPWTTMFTQNNIAITTIPASYGPFYYNSTTTESLAFRFLLGSSNHPVYVDDVEIREVLTLTNSVKTDIGNKKSVFEFFPNPATGKINIVTSFFQGKQAEVSILNLHGQPLVTHTFAIHDNASDSFTIDINLNSGIYFLEFKSDNVREVKTLVVK